MPRITGILPPRDACMCEHDALVASGAVEITYTGIITNIKILDRDKANRALHEHYWKKHQKKLDRDPFPDELASRRLSQAFRKELVAAVETVEKLMGGTNFPLPESD